MGTLVNILLVIALVIIVGLAVYKIYKAKKSGQKCMGCSCGCTKPVKKKSKKGASSANEESSCCCCGQSAPGDLNSEKK